MLVFGCREEELRSREKIVHHVTQRLVGVIGKDQALVGEQTKMHVSAATG
jgi:hypothetical protein